jgi:hypothetical protein
MLLPNNVGVTRVEFYVNSALTCTDTTMPFTCAWSVPNTANKTYKLQSKAYDAAANTGASAIITVTGR